jgi:hypothetical protein
MSCACAGSVLMTGGQQVKQAFARLIETRVHSPEARHLQWPKIEPSWRKLRSAAPHAAVY